MASPLIPSSLLPLGIWHCYLFENTVNKLTPKKITAQSLSPSVNTGALPNFYWAGFLMGSVTASHCTLPGLLLEIRSGSILVAVLRILLYSCQHIGDFVIPLWGPCRGETMASGPSQLLYVTGGRNFLMGSQQWQLSTSNFLFMWTLPN